jgi:hypothetical protein
VGSVIIDLVWAVLPLSTWAIILELNVVSGIVYSIQGDLDINYCRGAPWWGYAPDHVFAHKGSVH